MDLAIINTWLVSVNKGLGIIRDGCLCVEDDRITFVGKTTDSDYKSADIIIDGSDHVTMPGLVNAHTHTGLTLLRGCAQDVPEIEWMNKALGPLAHHLQKEDRVLGSQLGVIEGLRSGTTTFSEYTSGCSTLVEEVYLPFKVRVVATETINETVDRSHLGPKDLYIFDRSKGEKALTRTEELFRRYKSCDMVTCLYGPQALDMLSLETLKTVKEMAREHTGKIHMHVAQGERERLQITKRYNATTVQVLKDNGILDDWLIAVHIHDTSPEERELLVSTGVCMVGCPSSISMIDGITPPLYYYTARGGTAGIGTDQAPGPGTHNMFKEMRTASMLSKVVTKDPTALPAWESLQLGTVKGAHVLGLDTGYLAVGKKADIIMVDLRHPHLAPVIAYPFKTIVPNLVYSTTGAEVDTVIINGTVVMQDSTFTTIDEHAIIKKANKRAQKIVEEAEEDWKRAGSSLVNYVEHGWM